jgi:hypothetical protein
MKLSLSRLPRIASLILISILCVAMPSCKGKLNQQTTREPKPQKKEAPAPPTLAGVRAKVDSIYHGALTVDERRRPTFLAGDFNGDSSQDVLVAVRPNANKLADLNSDLAAWIVEDPRLIWVPDPNRVVQKMPPPTHHPVRVRTGDRLWVVIHGFREEGWRNPIATQSYLLVNVAANGLEQESAHQASAELKHNTPPLGIQYLLRYHGDVLRETMRGRTYLLYWTGGHYARTKITPEKVVPEKIAVNRQKAKAAM